MLASQQTTIAAGTHLTAPLEGTCLCSVLAFEKHCASGTETHPASSAWSAQRRMNELSLAKPVVLILSQKAVAVRS